MITRNTLSRLDRSLSILRWLLVAGVVILALGMPALDPQHGEVLRGRLLFAAVLGALLALANAGLLLWTTSDSPIPGTVSVALDTAYTLLLFWASHGLTPVLLGAGTLPIVVGALRVGSRHSAVAAITLAVAAPLLYGFAIAPYGGEITPVMLASGALLLIAAYIGLPVSTASLGWIGHQAALKAQKEEASRLRAAREQVRAIYEMASTLSATLNYQAVLDAALDVGVVGLREIGSNARVVSAVLLYDANTGQLKVANARRLTHADMKKQVPGRQGALGLALRKAEPVFTSDARRDPELRYFVAFQDARSILCVPLRAGFDNYGVLVFGCNLPNAFSEDHVELLSAIASQATIALQNATLYQNLLEEKERIIEVEEDARKQLSRDLHDGPTQAVAAIAMRVNYIRRLLERDPDQVPAELQKVEELARKTSKELRHMLFTLRPLILETQGLLPALKELATKMRETHDQNVILEIQENVDRYISARDQTVIFNIVEEAVNNARKHAEAEHIWVRLARQDRYLVLEVQDDGVGFDVGAVDANYDQRGSLGMLSLRERAELLDGTLRIESAEGQGTRIILIVEIEPEVLAAEANEAEKSNTAPTQPATPPVASPSTRSQTLPGSSVNRQH
ncbi:MAG: GAF domain-containing sensor histidine kinase [Anaerolineae bacterium]|nr:GAF domain-containing sensor histidine kinase [Anaerolineae bacterium]